MKPKPHLLALICFVAQPLLAQECHSAEAKEINAGLALDSREAVFKGGDSGVAVVPCQPAESLLITSLSRGIEGGDNGTVPSYARALTTAMASAAPGEKFPYGPIPFQCFGKNRCYVMPSLALVVIRMGDCEGREFSDNEFLAKLLGTGSPAAAGGK